jgi:DNA-binding HxlR family transcriptional regulator
MEPIANIPVTTATTTATKNTVAQVINPSDNIKMKACPIENTFKIISKKFTVLILRNDKRQTE